MTLHTDIPARRTIERLLQVRETYCVSIYLPTSRITAETAADRIELRNLVADAIRQLHDIGDDKHDIAAIHEALEEIADDDEFWTRQANSLAVFATAEGTQTFRLPNHLVAAVEVSDRFFLKPLLRAVTFPQTAYVLALSQGAVRLLEISPDAEPAEVAVAGMPTDAASAARKASIADRSPVRRMQGSEGQKVRMRQYARQVDDSLRGVLTGLDLPHILASTEPLDAIFRSVCSYPHLAATSIHGNPDRASDADLAEASRRVLDELYASELDNVRSIFETRSGQGRASTDIVDVARAATFGAVDTVLVDIDEVVPGSVDEETGAVSFDDTENAGNYGIVDEIARRVLLTGGRVLAVRRDDVPGEGSVAAILRYPV
jgi:hypothetical protein